MFEISRNMKYRFIKKVSHNTQGLMFNYIIYYDFGLFVP